MAAPRNILLLAGSAEAQEVATALERLGIAFDMWVSERPRGAAPLPHAARLQRFEDAQQMRDCIAAGGYRAIVDASHGFDTRMTEQSFDAAQALAVPYLHVARPMWDISANPRWEAAPDVASAAMRVGQGARVFSTTGYDSLGDFIRFNGALLLLRQTRPHTQAAPYPFVRFIFGDPPFTQAEEAALFERHAIDTLICRNLGGQASRPKLDAAALLDMRVIAVDKPPPPQGAVCVSRGHDALEWIADL